MPAAVTRLAAIGVRPAGYPVRGIRYLDPSHRADALFRYGHGLGVRRTTLHAALAARAAQLAVTVLPARVTGFTQHGGSVTAAGIEARYLVAADGLHSVIRRACALDPPPARHQRFGLRRHYQMPPWSDLVEVYWAPGSEAYVTPVADNLVGVAVLGGERGGFESRLAAFPALRERLAGAAPASDVRGAGPLRQDVRCRAARQRPARRRRLRLPRRADRRGHWRGAGPSGGPRGVRRGRPGRRLRTSLAASLPQGMAPHFGTALVPAPGASGTAHRARRAAAAGSFYQHRQPRGPGIAAASLSSADPGPGH